MTNEIVLIISLVTSYLLLLFAFKFFGKAGVFCWISICTILANIEVSALVCAFGMEQTLGNTLFASSFLATDILSEKFGKKDADKGVKIGILTMIAFTIFSLLWQLYSPSENDTAFQYIHPLFKSTPRILLSSLTAYIISEFLDVQLYHFIWHETEKKSSQEKFLWLRNNGATLLSQLVNIVLFNFGAFLGTYPMKELLFVTLSCYLIYIATSLLDTPFLYLARKIKCEN